MLHPTRTLELVEERNWFFRLSRYQGFLEQLLENPPGVSPSPRSGATRSSASSRQGLEDVSASRSRLGWGVPFPRATSDGEAQTTYVWFDALPNYWTASRFPGSGATWPAQLHVVGKDITRFHCVIWPAMLHAAGEALPERVWAHGFIYYGSDRFSKSAGVKLELREAIARHGPDALRFFLLREVGFANDGTFSWERFDERYISDLADGLGNLVSRSLADDREVSGWNRARWWPHHSGRGGAWRRYGTMPPTWMPWICEAAPNWPGAWSPQPINTSCKPHRGHSQSKEKKPNWIRALAALARCLIRLAVLIHPFNARKSRNSLVSPRAGCTSFGALGGSQRPPKPSAGSSQAGWAVSQTAPSKSLTVKDLYVPFRS